MAKSNRIASEDAPVYRAPPIDPDNTGHRIRAYLASMQPDPDTEFYSQIKTQINRGRSLMEHLAISAPGDEAPTLKLSPADCADILTFMDCCVPLNPGTWWNDRPTLGGISHVCGYKYVLDAMVQSLRAMGKRS